MSKQIAVRLDEALVDRIDALIEQGEVASRAGFVASALERELRHRLAEHDASVYAGLGTADPDDLTALARYGAHLPLDLA